MTKIKKNYTLELRGYDRVIIKTNRGFSNWYPYEEMSDYLEISAEIDRDTVSLKSEWKNPGVIEWHYRLMRNQDDSLANWQGFESALRLASEESINEAKNMIIKAVKSIKKIIKTGKMHPAYQNMESIAQDVIKHYYGDFSYNDTIQLSELTPEIKFIWVVRVSGTWLITEKSEFAGCIISQEIKENKYRSQDDKHLYYFWNGYKLKNAELEDIQTLYNNLPIR